MVSRYTGSNRRFLQVPRPGARFSKVPKLYGPFSGATIPFISQERRGFKSSSFSHFSFCHLENMLKDRLSKTSGWQFHKWLSDPKVFWTYEKQAPDPLADMDPLSRNWTSPKNKYFSD